MFLPHCWCFPQRSPRTWRPSTRNYRSAAACGHWWLRHPRWMSHLPGIKGARLWDGFVRGFTPNFCSGHTHESASLALSSRPTDPTSVHKSVHIGTSDSHFKEDTLENCTQILRGRKERIIFFVFSSLGSYSFWRMYAYMTIPVPDMSSNVKSRYVS